MRRTESRRDFLKQAAFTGAGLWVAGSRVIAQDEKGKPESPNEKLNIGVIAVGGKGGSNLDSVSRENIVALCDIDEKTLGKAAERFPQAKTYTDFRKLLDQKDVDAVVVSTPDHTHAVATLRAIKLGKHVYCEKPLTHSIHEARAVAAAAAKAKVATQMGNAGHSSENYTRTAELIQLGVIGPVREVHTWTNRPIWPQGIDRPKDAPPVPAHIHWDLWLGPAPERPYNPAYLPFNWRGWWDFGTGALGDMACHIMDPVFWGLNLGYPSAVEAESEGATAESPPRWSIIRYEFPARGSLPPVKLTWYDGGKLPPAELLDGEKPAENGGALFVGEKGNLLASHGGRIHQPLLLPKKQFEGFASPEPVLPRSPGHHVEWINACKQGGPTGTNFAYASVLTESILLGNVALRAGRRIEWDGASMRVANGSLDDLYIRRENRREWREDAG